MAFIFGTHPVDNGGIHMAALRSANSGMTSVQIFTTIPKFYGDKSMIKADRVKRFQETTATTKIRPGNVMVHAPYVLSVATAELERALSIDRKSPGGVTQQEIQKLQLAKHRDDRPRDGTAVAAELASVGDFGASAPRRTGPRDAAVTTGESVETASTPTKRAMGALSAAAAVTVSEPARQRLEQIVAAVRMPAELPTSARIALQRRTGIRVERVELG